jgi:hypothetical protein
MNFWATGVRGVFVLSLISVHTELTVWIAVCQAFFFLPCQHRASLGVVIQSSGNHSETEAIGGARENGEIIQD